MSRNFNTDVSGEQFRDQLIIDVWKKAEPIFGKDPNRYRKDTCGATIYFIEYGMTSTHGWEIDHIYPVALGGGDALTNLQPLHWKNNRSKSDRTSNMYCIVTE